MTSVAQATQTVTTEFNGWSNRETWMVNLWLTNEECYYHELCAILKNFKSTDEQAEELEVYVRFIVGVDENVGITTDLLTTSLSRVDLYSRLRCSKLNKSGIDMPYIHREFSQHLSYN